MKFVTHTDAPRATPDDIARIWAQLWGDRTAIMARTLSGNLTGKAAVQHWREIREDIATSEKREVEKLCEEIFYFDPKGYTNWLETTPDDNAGFAKAVRVKVEQLRQAAEIEADAEWLDVNLKLFKERCDKFNFAWYFIDANPKSFIAQQEKLRDDAILIGAVGIAIYENARAKAGNNYCKAVTAK